MNKMIKEFDLLVADSEKKGISIFKNPYIEHFIILCSKELDAPGAYEILEAYIKENENIFLEHMIDDSETQTIDTAILQLRNLIYKNHGQDALSRIQIV